MDEDPRSLYVLQKVKAEALACYKTIETDYPQSLEAYEISKNIARVAE